LGLFLHVGVLHYDEHGFTARAVNFAFRLLDAADFKQAHPRSTGPLSMITSRWFFDEGQGRRVELARHGVQDASFAGDTGTGSCGN
jgi:hypothetical protein